MPPNADPPPAPHRVRARRINFDALPLGGPGPGKLYWGKLLVWLALMLPVAALLGWVFVQVGERFAPWILLPILLGLCVGIAGTLLAVAVGFGQRTFILLGLIVAALVGIVTQHYGYYRMHVANLTATGGENAMLIQAAFPEVIPESLPKFLSQQAQRGRFAPLGGGRLTGSEVWISWGWDALLTTLAALVAGAVLIAGRAYCNQCGRWYVNLLQAELAAPAVLAVWEMTRRGQPPACLVAGTPPERLSSELTAHVRLWGCRRGCGPRQLVISWTNSAAQGRPAQWTEELWLTAAAELQLRELISRDTAAEPRD